MPIAALPTPPTRDDPANFAQRGDAFMAALPAFATEANALQTDVNAKQATASAAATTATAAAGTATTKAAEADADATTAAADRVQTGLDRAAAAASAASITAQVSVATHAAASKATPVDADEIPLADSADTFALKKLTWANLKATIASYLSGIAFPIGQTTPAAGSFTTLISDGLVAAGVVKGLKNAQTSYATAGLMSESATGDVYLGLHASGSSAAALKHTRGGNGISVVDAEGALAALNTGNSTVSGTLTINVPGTIVIPLTFGQAGDDPYIQLTRWTGAASDYYGGRVKQRAGAIAFEEAAPAALGAQTYTESMRVSGGSVGIGTTNPIGKQHIYFGNLTPTSVYEQVLNSPFSGSAGAAGGRVGTTFDLGGGAAGGDSGQPRSAGGGAARNKCAGVYGVSEDALYNRIVGLSIFTTAMDQTASEVARFSGVGHMLIGATSGTCHVIKKAVTQGNYAVEFLSSEAGSMQILAISENGQSGAGAGIFCGKNSTTGRTFNAAGTLNASGADYAEYERNNGLTIPKGSIVGFKADGTLTNIYADAVRFAVKSTNPSYVGGDTWGSEDKVGKRPDEPQFVAQAYTGSANPGDAPAAPDPVAEDATQEVLDAYAAALTAYESALAAHAATLHTYTMDRTQHAASVEVAKALFDSATYPEYERAKAAFEDRLESERQQVDRIAYSGKVPCNVLDTTPGGYVIAVDANGAIAGEFVADPDFAQYKKAVGRVNRLLPDGRCEVAVIIH